MAQPYWFLSTARKLKGLPWFCPCTSCICSLMLFCALLIACVDIACFSITCLDAGMLPNLICMTVLPTTKKEVAGWSFLNITPQSRGRFCRWWCPQTPMRGHVQAFWKLACHRHCKPSKSCPWCPLGIRCLYEGIEIIPKVLKIVAEQASVLEGSDKRGRSDCTWWGWGDVMEGGELWEPAMRASGMAPETRGMHRANPSWISLVHLLAWHLGNAI